MTPDDIALNPAPWPSAPVMVPAFCPPWAEVFGEDEFGVFAEFTLKEVRFVWRWIPPGKFLMGSPEGEVGRFDNEGPQHEMTITRGFWMGETPVTQAQWRVVVEATNIPLKEPDRLSPSPSRFQGPPELPVEQVSWDDCRKFCDRLSAFLPGGPSIGLPSEAQWEYACRAGTKTALYTGPLTVRGMNHGPELDLIAWYGGNSGRDLEVANPEDSSGWEEKQYNHKKAGTHRVKLKRPNGWGLYDTLGNVWEWCGDGKGSRSIKLGANPHGGMEGHEFRGMRGGSWATLAVGCTPEYYDLQSRSLASDMFGLRLMAFEVSGDINRDAQSRDPS